MGQQPNIELEMADLPRPTPSPAPARRWSPQRPGELGSPQDVPWGGMYGTPAPDAGYVLRMLRSERIDIGPGEKRADVDAALAAIASARASWYGRAPTREDIRVATTILGFGSPEAPNDLIETLEAQRPAWLAGSSHDPIKAQRLVAAIDPNTLQSTAADLAARLGAGERFIDLEDRA